MKVWSIFSNTQVYFLLTIEFLTIFFYFLTNNILPFSNNYIIFVSK